MISNFPVNPLRVPESIAEGITITDLTGKTAQANKAMARLHGFDYAQDMAGLAALDLVAPKDRDRAESEIRKVLGGGHSGNFEHTLRRKKVQEFAAELSTAPQVRV